MKTNSLIRANDLNLLNRTPRPIKSTTKNSHKISSPFLGNTSNNFFTPKKVEIFSIETDVTDKSIPKIHIEDLSFGNTKFSFGLQTEKTPTKIEEFSLFGTTVQKIDKGNLSLNMKPFSTSRSNWKPKKLDKSKYLKISKRLIFTHNKMSATSKSQSISSVPYLSPLLSMANSPMNNIFDTIKERPTSNKGLNGLSVIGNEATLPLLSKGSQSSKTNSTTSNLMWPPKIIRYDIADSLEGKNAKMLAKHKSDKQMYQTKPTNTKIDFGNCMKPIVNTNSRAMFTSTEMFLKKSKLFKFK